MTAAVKQLLKQFDSLSDAERREATAALIHRVRPHEFGDLPDEALVAAAEELFLELDAREAADGRP